MTWLCHDAQKYISYHLKPKLFVLPLIHLKVSGALHCQHDEKYLRTNQKHCKLNVISWVMDVQVCYGATMLFQVFSGSCIVFFVNKKICFCQLVI